ncbi:MAG: ricin lectin [Thermoleophilia bacterium]|nr:ricin lectin [Thermoleophilia bacterium]
MVHLRRLTAACALVAIVASTLAFSVAAQGGPRSARTEVSREQAARAASRADAAARLDRAARTAPRATSAGSCARTAPVPGQGASCRSDDGLYVVPQAGGRAITTHGPDLITPAVVPAVGRAAARAGGFGTAANFICSSQLRTRHVQLVYLLPADYATQHGDRYASQVDVLRAALYDASALVDRRAGELAPGTRRRIRVACGTDGLPSVLRVVLPRTAAAYRSAASGFGALHADLRQLGLIRRHAGYAVRALPELRRVVGYYDANFVDGVVGQGTMYTTAALVADTRNGITRTNPLVGTTRRNINNNGPEDSLAVQYGTSYAGQPDPPSHTGLLHELSHTMGAVQDEPPTSSGRGHCTDGLDVLCYDDRGPAGGDSRYVDTVCPDLVPPITADDEQYDCNGDTYFHPAPPASNPLARPRTWQLGLAGNETFSTDRTASPAPARVRRLTVRGSGTSLRLTWPAVTGDRRRTYDVIAASTDRAPVVASAGATRSFRPLLRPRTTYELAVRAVDGNGDVGAVARATFRTGRDTTAPSRPTGLGGVSVTRTTLRLRWQPATDNVAVRRYRLEQQVAPGRWRVLGRASTRLVAGHAMSPAITGLRPGRPYTFRVRAIDGAGNVSAPAASARVVTPR